MCATMTSYTIKVSEKELKARLKKIKSDRKLIKAMRVLGLIEFYDEAMTMEVESIEWLLGK